MALEAVLCFLSVILLLSMYLVHRRFQYWTIRGVFSPPAKFPFGNFEGAFFTRPQGVQVRDLYNALKGKGSIGGLFSFMVPNVMVMDLDLLRSVLVKDFDHFPHRPIYVNAKADHLSLNLFTVDVETWKKQRSKFSPIFSSGKIKSMQETFLFVAERLNRNLLPKAEIQSEVEWMALFTQYTTDVIGHIVLGLDVNVIEDPEGDFYKFRRAIVKTTHWSRFKRLFSIAFPELSAKLNIELRSSELTEFFTNMVRKTVEYREQNKGRRNDFLQLLMDIRVAGEANEGRLTLKELAAQTFLFLLAGSQTSSTTMTWAAYELALHPDVQERAREEIRRVLKMYDGKMTYEAIQEMRYLDQVINETMRKNPASTFLRRKTYKAYKVPGTEVVIEKGTPLWVSILGIHNDPEYYPEPEKFDPDRFTKEKIAARHPYAFLSFGDGPRACIGLRFAKMQMRIGLATLLNNYKLSPSEKTAIPMKLNPNSQLLTPHGGAYLRIEKAAIEGK